MNNLEKIIFDRIVETKQTRIDQIIQFESGHCIYIINSYPFNIVMKMLYHSSDEESIKMNSDNIITSLGFNYNDNDTKVKRIVKEMVETYDDICSYETALKNMLKV